MKKSIVCFITSNILLLGSASATQNFNLDSFSSCEQNLFQSLSKNKTSRNIAMGGSIAVGTLAGFGTYGFLVVSDSSSQSSEAVFGGASPATSGGQIILSAVSSGVAIASLGIGAAYLDYRNYVDTSEAVLLLFKDVKNNGMGPEIELRTKTIQQILQEIETAGALKKYLKKLKKYNPETYSEENVVAEFVNVSKLMVDSEVVDCRNAKKVSESIDEKVISNLIHKFNPDLKAQIK